MALIPITFKNNDTEKEKFKTGKLNTRHARLLFSNFATRDVGVFKNYRKDSATEPLTISSTEVSGSKTSVFFNKGAVSIYGGIGVVEQGTRFDIEGLDSNIMYGSLGIKVDLKAEAGSEMTFYARRKDILHDDLRKDNLIEKETDGVYELELYEFSTGNSGEVNIRDRKVIDYIDAVSEFSGDDGVVAKANELVPTRNSSGYLAFQVGNHSIGMWW